MKRLLPEPLKIGASAYDLNRRPTRWHPGPVEDAEVFCRKYLDDAFDGWGMFLRPSFYDDSLQELIIILHRCEARYNPERMATFEQYGRWICSQRAVDVGPRRVLGRNGSRTPDYVFDELPDGGLGGVVPEGAGDQTALSGRDERWLQPDYPRQRARALAILGLVAPGGTEERDRAAIGAAA